MCIQNSIFDLPIVIPHGSVMELFRDCLLGDTLQSSHGNVIYVFSWLLIIASVVVTVFCPAICAERFKGIELEIADR